MSNIITRRLKNLESIQLFLCHRSQNKRKM
jgi:hypothetical protein